MSNDIMKTVCLFQGGVKTMINKLRNIRELKSKHKSFVLTGKYTIFGRIYCGILIVNGDATSVSFIDNNLVVLIKAGFQKPTFDTFDLEDIKKNGTASAEISPTCFLAGESTFYSHR